MRKHIDPASLVVIGVTLVLFLTALVVKGVGHDLLLEGGVFLVSVKLIIMAYKASVSSQAVTEDLAAIRDAVQRLERQAAATSGTAGDSTPGESGNTRAARGSSAAEGRTRS